MDAKNIWKSKRVNVKMKKPLPMIRRVMVANEQLPILIYSLIY